jgi:hypothetical protein
MADFKLKKATNSLNSGDPLLPYDFPAPQLALPEKGFAPDYFTLAGYHFCSRQFRDALAQSDPVVQYTPIELVKGGALVRAQEYQRLRVIAWQRVLDLERSDCKIEEIYDPATGRNEKFARSVNCFVLRDNLHSQSEIFRMRESGSIVLVTDALAERVLRAGCTGMEFTDPSNPRFVGIYWERYRTLDGIGERLIGA